MTRPVPHAPFLRCLASIAFALLLLVACRDTTPAPPSAPLAPPGAVAAPAAPVTTDAALTTRVPNQVIRSHGRVVFRGTVDLGATIRRIRAGEPHPHRRDGSVFQNRERRLPIHPRGYYREWVHPTAGERGPGPQRIVTGRGDEWYYTPDHYESFIPLHEDAP